MSRRTPSRLIALPAALVALAMTVPAASATTAPSAGVATAPSAGALPAVQHGTTALNVAHTADGALARALNFAVEGR